MVDSVGLNQYSSCSSGHKEDMYSSGGYIYPLQTYRWNHNGYSCCYGTEFIWYVRIAENGNWKEFARTPVNQECGDPYCWQCAWFNSPGVSTRFWKAGDPENGKFIDKVAVEIGGLRDESFVNRMMINVTAREDITNTPIPNVEIYRSPVTDSNEYLCNKAAKEFDKIRRCIWDDAEYKNYITGDCSLDPNGTTCFDTISIYLKNGIERSLVSCQQWGDVVELATPGIPDKLTWNITQAGSYTGGNPHWQYFSTEGWKYFPEESLIDETKGFTKTGTKNIYFPPMTDWIRTRVGYSTDFYYLCRAIWDSDITVVTIPRANSLRWSGQYSFVTDINGNLTFSVLSNQPGTLDIPGKIPGYICKSGCGSYNFTEGQPSLNVNLVFVDSDLNCSITCPTTPTVYKFQTRNVLVTSNVGFGNIQNTLRITPPTIVPSTAIINSAFDSNIDNWTVTTSGDASVVWDNGRARLRARNAEVCSRSMMEQTFTVDRGNISFDWETFWSGSPDRPGWKLSLSDGTVIINEILEGFSGTKTFNISSYIGQEVAITFYVLEYIFCPSGDHYYTHLWIDNVIMTGDILRSDIPSGTNIPVGIAFTQTGLHKIQLTSVDDGDNVCSKTCYADVQEAPSCNVYTDKLSCEASGCYWDGINCLSEPPVNELIAIYESIISGQTCISNDCLPILDLNGDGTITNEDLTLAQALTSEEILDKLLSYRVCNILYPCGVIPPTPTGNTAIIIAAGAGAITLLYYLYTRRKKQ